MRMSFWINLLSAELHYAHHKRRLRSNGFTLTEFVAVVAIIAVLISILAPSWTSFLARQRLVSAQNIAYQGIQQAQVKSQQNHSEWQFSIREVNGFVEWSVHPKSVYTSVSQWKPLGDSSIKIDSETTLQLFGNGRTVRFGHKGNVVSRLGRVTLSSKQSQRLKRCVYVSTIIGALRQAKEQSTTHDGDYCY